MTIERTSASKIIDTETQVFVSFEVNPSEDPTLPDVKTMTFGSGVATRQFVVSDEFIQALAELAQENA